MSQITNTADLQTLTGNGGGGAVSPLNGNITLVGGAGIAVTGNQAAHTITISNTGAEASTFHSDSGGNATPIAGVVNIFGDPGLYIATTAAGNTLRVEIQGATLDAVQIGDAGGGLTNTNVGSNGQLLIGSSIGAPAFASVTSSDNSITITEGSNTLDLKVTGGGISWVQVNSDTTMVSNHGYITEGIGQLLMALPATSAVGDQITIVDAGDSDPTSPWRVTTAGLQVIFAAGSENTGLGGYIEPVGGTTDCAFSTVTLRCITANKFWVVESSVANLTFV